MGSFNSFSLSSKTRTPLAVPYNRLTQSVSWLSVWQLGREQLCEEASPWCQSTSLSNFRWQSHYYTLSASARKMDRNLKSQRASATWEQESWLSAAPYWGLSPLKLCQCLDPDTSLPSEASPKELIDCDFWRATESHPQLLWCQHHCSLSAASLWKKTPTSSFAEMQRCPAWGASFPSASPSLITNSCKNGLPCNMSNKLQLQKPFSLLLGGYFLLAPSFKRKQEKETLEHNRKD